ncbi:MAG TPA: flavodoxin domain-containing protein [Candidatus Dormibacteraeota bacterium]|nr:flavodoxin domain-containing protein [Candidatus Dormibacteraeota bacterium]
MRVLVVYASKYGATRGIAERITATLKQSGLEADMVPAGKAGSLDGYDGFVIGSAAYMFSWLHEATDFIRRNAALLKTKPVWLFSSGPIGNNKTDEKGRDVLETTVPKEFAEFEQSIHPRGLKVFFGAFDHTKLSFAHRMVYAMPAMKNALLDGDWRDWDAIDAWAMSIASSLTPAITASSS